MASRPQPAPLEGGGLGERLRRERESHGLSLGELARRLEVSPSLVSQIETGKIQPSVRTLYAIVSELGVSLDDLFGTEQPPPNPRLRPAEHLAVGGDESAVGHVQRAGTRRQIDLETGVRWERLTPRNEPGVEFLFTTYPPGSDSTAPESLVRHTGREFGLVLSGKLGLTVGFEEYLLESGDSIFFDSTVPHRLHNDAAETVTAVWVVLGRQP